jgi:hypothetical protein
LDPLKSPKYKKSVGRSLGFILEVSDWKE